MGGQRTEGNSVQRKRKKGNSQPHLTQGVQSTLALRCCVLLCGLCLSAQLLPGTSLLRS